jgi:4-methylaminobutanoate oxidase (methylamine-forming)
VRVAVVGAGLAGLACAVDLARAGADVTVHEARERVGGRVWSAAMPDGTRIERGGEFIETGYDHMLRRAAEHALALAEHGFEFAAREVRSGGQVYPALLLEAERALAATVKALGADASAVSAAAVLQGTPLAPLARTALTRRLEGTYTVELECVSASWLASAEVRAAESATHLGSSRLAAGNDALAKALAAELGDRVRLGCAVADLRNVEGGVTLAHSGVREEYERVVLAVPLTVALHRLLPALRERRSYERLQWGVAAKLHVPLAEPAAPAAVQGLEAAFWTWTARAADGGPATVAASFAGGFRATETFEIIGGEARWRAAIERLRPELALGDGALLTRWWNDADCDGAYSCHPPGWSRADDAEVAAPYGHIHLAGEHTAAEFCGTMEGALRSGSRAAREVLAAGATAKRRH